MFGHTYKTLTEASNHYIDWSRTAELLTSETHHYNQHELLVRGTMAAVVAASGLLGAYLNNPDNTNCSTLTVAIASSVLGLAIAHIPVIYTLVSKRYSMSTDCDELAARIDNTLEKMSDLSQETREQVNAVKMFMMTLSLSNDEHANASLTWGTRKKLLTQLAEQVETNTFDAAYWHIPAEQRPAGITLHG